jgi:PAS domain S-box-containing protein
LRICFYNEHLISDGKRGEVLLETTEKRTILLVEDDQLTAKLERLQLEKEGYRVLHAACGETGIEMACSPEAAVDLVLMDIDLGDGMDGTQAAQEILLQRQLPILFLSSHIETEIVQKTEAISSYGYVVKNSSFTVLDASIKMAFKLYEAHKKIAANEAMQSAMLTNVTDVVGIIGADGIMKYESPNMEKWFGWKTDEIVGHDGWATVHPGDLARLRQSFELLLQTPGDVRSDTFRNRCKDGSYKWVEITAQNCLCDPVINGILFNYHDISKYQERDEQAQANAEELIATSEELEAMNEELKATLEELEATNQELTATLEELEDSNRALLEKEAALRTEKAFIEAVFESIPGYLYVYDQAGNLVRWNEKHETMTGYSAEELAKMKLADWFDAEDYQRVQAAAAEVFRTGSGEVEAHLLTKSGQKLLIRSNGVLFEHEGQAYFTGVGTDITQLREVEEKLKKRAMLLRETEATGKIGGWEFDVATMEQTWTDEIFRILEIDMSSGEPVVPKGVDFISPAHRPMAIAGIKRVIEEGIPYDQEWEVITDKGNKRWVHAVGKAAWENGKIVTIRGSFQDITQRKEAELSVQKLLREKEIILREVHHRVKNNMNVIHALLVLQANEQSDPVAVRILQDAAGRVQSMLVLYDRLYRAEDLTSVSIKDYFPALINEIDRIIPRPIPVEVEHNFVDIVLGPKLLAPLGIILNELLTNAFKHAFIGRKQGRIEISAAQDGAQVILRVKDDGQGLTTATPPDMASGFGMQLVEMLVEQINGTLEISSNEGAQFVIRFAIEV